MLATAPDKAMWSRRNPFPATLLRKVLLSPPSEPRAKYHYELSLSGSELSYQPGDSLAIVPENDPVLVDALLARLGMRGSEEAASFDLRTVLQRAVTITKPSRKLLSAIAAHLPPGSPLPGYLEPGSDAALSVYLAGRDVLDLVAEHPQFFAEMTANEFVALLPKLQPRLYSFASSMRVHGGVAHLFVSSVEYECLGRLRKGVCTSHLAERVALFATVPVFVHAALHFHLPAESEAAVIMIGAGTGVAPFRAFLEERAARGSAGKSWLFFGQRHRATGFYYRDDWLDFLRTGVLTQLDTAFSHDQPERIYVQHRMLEHAPELWTWLRDGAHVYLCGDALMLAPAVDAALEQIAAHCGHLSPREAAAFVQTLREKKRYHRDAY